MTNSKQANLRARAGDDSSERPNTDADIKTQNIPANEETEGVTNALEAPSPPPEMTKDRKIDKT
jgi:hypothetical protein